MAQKKLLGYIVFPATGLIRDLYWKCPLKKCNHFTYLKQELTPSAMHFNLHITCRECESTYDVLCFGQYTDRTASLFLSNFVPGEVKNRPAPYSDKKLIL